MKLPSCATADPAERVPRCWPTTITLNSPDPLVYSASVPPSLDAASGKFFAACSKKDVNNVDLQHLIMKVVAGGIGAHDMDDQDSVASNWAPGGVSWADIIPTSGYGHL